MLDHLNPDADDNNYDPTAGDRLKLTPYNAWMWYTGQYGKMPKREVLRDTAQTAAVDAKKATVKHGLPSEPPKQPPPKPVITAQPQSAQASPLVSPAGGASARSIRPERWSLHSDSSSHSGNSSSASSSTVSPVITPASAARSKHLFAFTDRSAGGVGGAPAEAKRVSRRFSQPEPPKNKTVANNPKASATAAAAPQSPLLLGFSNHQLHPPAAQPLPPPATTGKVDWEQLAQRGGIIFKNGLSRPEAMPSLSARNTQLVEAEMTVTDITDAGLVSTAPVSPTANSKVLLQPSEDLIEIMEDPLSKGFQATSK